MKTKNILSLLLLLTISSLTVAQEFVVDQKNLKFSVKKLSLKKGDTVKFTNSDYGFHNIFSLSEADSFDLGSYSNGSVRIRKFNHLGRVQIECAIHPYMEFEIIVK